MGILQSLVAVLAKTDEILGPKILDLTPSAMTIEVRTYPAGLKSSQGPYTVTSTLVLPRSVQMRTVTTKEIAQSGGRYDAEDVFVGPIRPQFRAPDGTTGGYTKDQIDPARTASQNPTTHQGTDVAYILNAEYSNMAGLSGEYTLLEFRHDDWTGYTLVLTRRRG